MIGSMLVAMTPHESRIQKRQHVRTAAGGTAPPMRPPCDVYDFDKIRVNVARSPETTAESDKIDNGSVPLYAHPLMGKLDPDYGPTWTSGDHGGGRGNPLHKPWPLPPSGRAGRVVYLTISTLFATKACPPRPPPSSLSLATPYRTLLDDGS